MQKDGTAGVSQGHEDNSTQGCERLCMANARLELESTGLPTCAMPQGQLARAKHAVKTGNYCLLSIALLIAVA